MRWLAFILVGLIGGGILLNRHRTYIIYELIPCINLLRGTLRPGRQLLRPQLIIGARATNTHYLAGTGQRMPRLHRIPCRDIRARSSRARLRARRLFPTLRVSRVLPCLIVNIEGVVKGIERIRQLRRMLRHGLPFLFSLSKCRLLLLSQIPERYQCLAAVALPIVLLTRLVTRHLRQLGRVDHILQALPPFGVGLAFPGHQRLDLFALAKYARGPFVLADGMLLEEAAPVRC